MAKAHEIRTYTIGRPPQTTGLGGLSMKVTILIGITFMVSMVFIWANQWKLAFMAAAIGAVLIGLVNLRVAGRSVASHMQLAWQRFRRNGRGENLYVAGQDSRIPGGRFSLPGVLARQELVSSEDSTGRPYAVAVDRANNQATVFFSLQLTGAVDRTGEERDQNTADWARFEAGLSLSGDVVSCVTVVANRPATGQLAEQEVRQQVKDDAPALARKIMGEAASMLSVGGGELEAHMALTFKIDRIAGDDDDEFVRQMDYRIPNIYPQLSWAGIRAEPMDYEEVVSRAHTFFNPSSETLFEQIRVEGRQHHLDWENAGPTWALADNKLYAHENCRSVSWEMIEAPSSTFEDTALTPLARHNAHVPRSRMAMIYEPVPASRGMKMVEREHKDALVGMNSSKSITKIGATVRAEETESARRAVARGAQMGLRSLLFTATMGPDEDINRVTSAVEQAGSQASIRLHQMTGMHDAGFELSAGLGVTPEMRGTTSGLLR